MSVRGQVREGNYGALDELRLILPSDVFPERRQWGPPPRVDGMRVAEEIQKALSAVADCRNSRLPVVLFTNGRKALARRPRPRPAACASRSRPPLSGRCCPGLF